MVKKKSVTIDDLALMVQGGFSDLRTEMDERFNAMDKKFDAVDERFNAVDEKFNAIYERFNDVELKIDGVRSIIVIDQGKRIAKLEKAVFAV